MNSGLIDNVNNTFYTQRNVLTGREGEVTALVEDYADTSLWFSILKSARPDKSFRMSVYQEGSNRTQSKPLIVDEIQSKGGELYIGCVDSDQSYLLRQYGNNLGVALENNNYLFHTYAYSRENLHCMPSTLLQVVVDATSLQTTFDFQAFFAGLSNSIYPVFLLDLFLRSKQSKTVLNVDKWKNIFPGEKAIKASFRNGTPNTLIAEVAKKTKTFEKQLQRAPEYNVGELSAFEQQMLTANGYVNKDNCCLFIYGHEFFDFVSILVSVICDLEVDAEQNRINASQLMAPDVKAERLGHIRNIQRDPKVVLGMNSGFILQGGQLYQNINADLRVLV
jgi:hypothetical protein